MVDYITEQDVREYIQDWEATGNEGEIRSILFRMKGATNPMFELEVPFWAYAAGVGLPLQTLLYIWYMKELGKIDEDVVKAILNHNLKGMFGS